MLPFPASLAKSGQMLQVEIKAFMPLSFEKGSFVLRLPTSVPMQCLPPVREHCMQGSRLLLQPIIDQCMLLQ